MSIHHPKPVVRVAVAVVQRDRHFLVAKRRADVHLGGLWEFPGGKLHEGESPDQAAVRELLEECGVLGEAQSVLGEYVHEYADRVVVLTAVWCRWIDGEARPLCSDACEWVRVDDLRSLNMPAMNEEIIRAALARAAGA